MIDVSEAENMFSSSDPSSDGDEHYDAVEFDPECTFVDDEIDNDTLAFRDAVRDIWATEGRFDLILP